MILIGEKLNSSIPKTLEALQNRDEDYIVSLIRAQSEAGADVLDLNAALLGDGEADGLKRLIGLCQKYAPSCTLMLDSPNPPALLEAAKEATAPLIFNSVTVTERVDELLPAVLQYRAGVVALPIAGSGIPESADDRMANASAILERLISAGVPEDKIYMDVLVETISTGGSVMTTLGMLGKMHALYPAIKTVCGLSNVSFGLPKRVNLNAAFLSMAVAGGLDAVIMDVTSKPMRTALYSALALCGHDEYCMDYISYIRETE